MAARFVEAWDGLDISNDDFIRTTEPRHHLAVQQFLQKIHDNGFTELGVYRGPVLRGVRGLQEGVRARRRQLPDPRHAGGAARGGELLLQAERLRGPAPRVVRGPPRRRATRRRSATRPSGIIKGGLEDISITRTSTRWGVEVPWDEAHVFYVWYDALVNYLTAIGYGDDPARFDAWWPAVHHLLGKDIIRFHCVWWPAMCMAAGIDPPAHLLVHGWLLVSGEKMSKSKANQIAPRDLTDDFGVDAVRYFLLRDTPFGADGDFSYEGITARYNADLANNLGNLVARVATVVGSKCDGVGPAADPDSRLARRERRGRRGRHRGVGARGSRTSPSRRRGDSSARPTPSSRRPSRGRPSPVPACPTVLGSALEALRIVALLASPAMPDTSAEIWRRLGLDGRPEDRRLPEDAAWGGYPGGLPVEKAAPLFPRRSE